MSKLALAALAAFTLTSIAILPSSAQSTACPEQRCPSHQDEPPCGEQLGYLKRVFPAEVAGISDDHRVWVTEFCPTGELMRSDGNAAYLRTAIADNQVLVDVLGAKGYFPDDVFAVRMMGDDTISLYVHRFDNHR